jgi:hypothetical protein
LLYIDVKYVSFIAGRLRNFAKKDANLWNCACPICLDSASNKSKARGYIYMREQKLYYMCHNCGASMGFGKFLEQVDPVLHGEYRLETYREKYSGDVDRKKVKKEEDVEDESLAALAKTDVASRFKSKVSIPQPRLLDGLLDRLDTLPPDHEAVQYVAGRDIAKDQWHKIYFIPNMLDIVQLSAKYEDRIRTNEPRIVLPFYDMNGQLTGVTCRAIRGEKLRYVVVKVKDDAPLVFGINDIDKSKLVYVVEGPIDSLFLPNAIAVGGTSMGKTGFLGLRDKVVIFDNQPRNPDVCRIMAKSIREGNKVVVWSERITAKDINEMHEQGIDYMSQIKARTFQGLQAQLEFDSWKKC